MEYLGLLGNPNERIVGEVKGKAMVMLKKKRGDGGGGGGDDDVIGVTDFGVVGVEFVNWVDVNVNVNVMGGEIGEIDEIGEIG